MPSPQREEPQLEVPDGPAGWRTFYPRAYAVMWGAIAGFPLSEAEREDTAQEAMGALVSALPRWDPKRATLNAYVAGIARKKALAVLRSKRRSVVVGGEMPVAMPARGWTPESAATIRQLAQHLYEELDDEEGPVVILRDVFEHEWEEIATLLEMHVSKVRRRYESGTKKLRSVAESDPDSLLVIPAGFLALFDIAGADLPPREVTVRACRRAAEVLGHEGEPPESGTRCVEPHPRHDGVPRSGVRRVAWPIAGVLLGLAMGAAWSPRQRRPDTAAVPVSDSTPIAAQPSALSQPSTPEMPVAPPSASMRAHQAVEPMDDRGLLDKARNLRASGQTDAALVALRDHAQRFAGWHGETREQIWIEVLIDAGRLDEARVRLSGFARAYPKSAKLGAFRQALAPPSP